MNNNIKEEIEKADDKSLDEMLTAIYARKRTPSAGGGGANNKT